MRRRPKNILPNGRTAIAPFLQLPHLFLHSAAYRSLSPADRSLLLELATLYNGYNNGSIWLSVRDAAARMGVVDLNTATTAFRNLQERGLIVMSKDAYFEIKASDTSRARCWRLTWQPSGNRPATHNYRDYIAEPNSKDNMRMQRGLKVLKEFVRAKQQNKMPVLDSDTNR